MDAISALLAGQHSEGAFVLRSDFAPPWCLRIEDEAPLTVMVVLRGEGYLVLDGRPAIRLGAGDAALVRGTTSYAVADDLRTPPQALIGPGQSCSRPDSSPLTDFRFLGSRAWTNRRDVGAPAPTVLLTGTYTHAGHVGHRLLEHLPTYVVAPADRAPRRVGAAVAMLAEETEERGPAQDVVVDRVVDVLTVSLLRWWFASDAGTPAWILGGDDEVVGEALRRMHHEPEREWTLARLAADVGVSRATLARRFGAQVGEPPMSYLSRWRLDLAADLLARTDLTVGSVAARVGFASPFSLSAAFSRRHGEPPSAYRARAAAHE